MFVEVDGAPVILELKWVGKGPEPDRLTDPEFAAIAAGVQLANWTCEIGDKSCTGGGPEVERLRSDLESARGEIGALRQTLAGLLGAIRSGATRMTSGVEVYDVLIRTYYADELWFEYGLKHEDSGETRNGDD